MSMLKEKLRRALAAINRNKSAFMFILTVVIVAVATIILLLPPSSDPVTPPVSGGETKEEVKNTEEETKTEPETSPSTEPDVTPSTSTTAPTTTTRPPVSSKPPVSSNPNDWKYNGETYPVTVHPPEGTNYVFRTDIDMDDNIFMDSLGYTGYNLAKHRQDGQMWNYILSSDKRWRGWLTEIGYDYNGDTTGYETTPEGLPDIDYFVKHDLVCASYITYVYFNYIPNVVGTDVSMLCKPQNPKLANDWYKTAKQWVLDGYSVQIPFSAKLTGSGFINFSTEQEIPIGSLIFFCDARNRSDWSTHVCIYAGYRNGNHWVYHVGNDNGPEFCAVERMHFGSDPQWPIGVFATPSVIEFK